MKEFERRWVIEFPELASEKLEPLSIGTVHHQDVCTTYLSSNWRIKKVSTPSSIRYFLTKKMPKNKEGFRSESTIELTPIEYRTCLDQSPLLVGDLTYHRMKVVGSTNYDAYGIVELCIDQIQEGPTIVEVEFKDAESMNRFSILDSMREIKMKGSYKYYLAKKGYGLH